jgi:competence protein ComEC
MMPWDRSIDTIIATHPDKDHIGGFPDVLEHYVVKNVIDNGFSTEKSLAREYRSLVDDEGSQYMQMITPEKIELDDGVVLNFIRDYGKSQFDLDSNDGSIALRIDYQGYSFFMMGDAESDVEESVLRDVDPELLNVDILKLGHHGSKTSSTEEFLRATSPNIAVISAGLNNSYGHPHKEVTDRLDMLNIPYVCTCERGRISFIIKDGEMRGR